MEANIYIIISFHAWTSVPGCRMSSKFHHAPLDVPALGLAVNLKTRYIIAMIDSFFLMNSFAISNKLCPAMRLTKDGNARQTVGLVLFVKGKNLSMQYLSNLFFYYSCN